MKASLVLLLAFGAAVATASLVVDPEDVPNWSYQRYVYEFNKPVKAGSTEYMVRKALFDSRVKDIIAHNADPTKTWKRTINRFADMTEEERSVPRGGGLYYGPRHPLRRDFESPAEAAAGLPESVDWRQKGVVSGVKDQGQCGSCWAHAATETVESHVAIASGQLPVLSQQQIASCTQNPHQCGGTGGCQGATNELGMQSVAMLGGIAEEWTYPYLSFWGTDYECRFNNTNAGPSGTPAVAMVSGYVKLPANNYTAVMEAIAFVGPLAITVDAGQWFDYAYGVYNGCGTDSVSLDHGVQLVGYGVDPQGGPYWTVRNSWGTGFGEEGYIRIKRFEGNNPCGIDTDPSGGVGCAGGPPTQKVCGSCGILSDVSYPTGAKPARPSPPM